LLFACYKLNVFLLAFDDVLFELFVFADLLRVFLVLRVALIAYYNSVVIVAFDLCIVFVCYLSIFRWFSGFVLDSDWVGILQVLGVLD